MARIDHKSGVRKVVRRWTTKSGEVRVKEYYYGERVNKIKIENYIIERWTDPRDQQRALQFAKDFKSTGLKGNTNGVIAHIENKMAEERIQNNKTYIHNVTFIRNLGMTDSDFMQETGWTEQDLRTKKINDKGNIGSKGTFDIRFNYNYESAIQWNTGGTK